MFEAKEKPMNLLRQVKQLMGMISLPQPPKDFRSVRGADLKVGMRVSLHDRPDLEAAVGEIYLLDPKGRRWNEFGEALPDRFFVFIETPEGSWIRHPVLDLYWNDKVWIMGEEPVGEEL